MPRPRARLDQAAIARAFAPDGLHGVSATDIARRAGVAKPTLYAHGRSKEALFLACVEAAVERQLERVYAADAQSRDWPLEQRATTLALCLLDHAAAEPAGFRLLAHTARHASSSVAGAVDCALERVPARLAAALRRDLEPEDARVAAAALHGAAVGMAAARAGRVERASSAALLGRALAAVARGDAGPAVHGGAHAAVDASAIY